MGRIKRFAYFAYVIATAAALAMLVLPWRGPWTGVFNPLFAESEPYALVLFACLGIAFVGLVVILVRAIATPSSRRIITIEQVDGGSITLDVDAITSQVKYLIEGQGSCEVSKIKAQAKGKSKVAVTASLRPYRAANLAELGEVLQNMVYSKLNEFTGGAVDSVTLHFLQAEDQAFDTDVPLTPMDLQVDFPAEPEPLYPATIAEPDFAAQVEPEPELEPEPEPTYEPESAQAEEPSATAENVVITTDPETDEVQQITLTGSLLHSKGRDE